MTTPFNERMARLEVLVERHTDDVERLKNMVTVSFDRSVGGAIVAAQHEHKLAELTKEIEYLRHAVRGLQQGLDILAAPRAPWWRRLLSGLLWVARHLGSSSSQPPKP